MPFLLIGIYCDFLICSFQECFICIWKGGYCVFLLGYRVRIFIFKLYLSDHLFKVFFVYLVYLRLREINLFVYQPVSFCIFFDFCFVNVALYCFTDIFNCIFIVNFSLESYKFPFSVSMLLRLSSTLSDMFVCLHLPTWPVKNNLIFLNHCFRCVLVYSINLGFIFYSKLKCFFVTWTMAICTY